MLTLQEKALQDLARATSATGKIIEAHADEGGRACRVVIEVNQSLKNAQLREAITQLWLEDGFIASISRDGHYLMIDGLRGEEVASSMDLIGMVAHQIKEYTKSSMRNDSRIEMTGADEVAFLASALDERDSASTR